MKLTKRHIYFYESGFRNPYVVEELTPFGVVVSVIGYALFFLGLMAVPILFPGCVP